MKPKGFLLYLSPSFANFTAFTWLTHYNEIQTLKKLVENSQNLLWLASLEVIQCPNLTLASRGATAPRRKKRRATRTSALPTVSTATLSTMQIPKDSTVIQSASTAASSWTSCPNCTSSTRACLPYQQSPRSTCSARKRRRALTSPWRLSSRTWRGYRWGQRSTACVVNRWNCTTTTTSTSWTIRTSKLSPWPISSETFAAIRTSFPQVWPITRPLGKQLS